MFAFVACIGALLTACEEEIPFIILDQEAVIVGNETEKVNVDVRANVPWKAETTAQWVHVFAENGNYKGAFEILVDANPSVNDRVATVTVSGSGVQVSLLITQSGSELALTVPVPEYSVSNDEQDLRIRYLVTSKEVEVDAISEAMWAEVVSVADGNCDIKIAENKTGKDREAAITFVTSYGIKPAILGSTLIKQSAKGVVLVVPVENYALTNEAQTLKLSYTITDSEAEVKASANCNWISVVGVASGVAELSISENISGEERSGVVTLVTVTRAGEAVSASTTICQAATENVLDVVVDDFEFAPEGETLTIPVVTNSNIEVVCTSEWCTAVVKDKVVALTATANMTGARREAYATITVASGKGNILSKKVKLTQEAVVVPDDVLDIHVTELNFDGDADSIKVPFTSDSKVEAKTSSDWLSAEVKGSDVLVSVTENNTANLRKGFVTLTTANGVTGVITVYQAPVVVDSKELTILVPEFRVLSAASQTIIPFAARTAVTARSNKSWCAVSVNGNDVTADIAANEGEQRDAFITLTTKTGVSGIVHVIQNAAENDDDSETVEVLVEELNFEGGADKIKVPFVADARVSVRTSSDWISAAVTGSDVEVSVEENWTGAERKGFVTLQTSDMLAAIITVNQASLEPEFEFNMDELNVGFRASTNYLRLSSTGAWKLLNTEAQIPGWLEVSPVSGDGDETITVNVKSNKFAVERSAVLFFLNTEFGLKANVIVCQAENPTGISNYLHLGKGYDASGNYAEDQFVKSAVLDCEALGKADCISDIVNTNQTVEEIIRGSSLEEYENNYSAEAGLSGKYEAIGFSGSVKSNFSSKALGSSEHSFATFRHVTKKQILKINENENASTLMSCRSEVFVSDIEKLSADALVAKYGTHVIMGFSVGGVIDYSMAADVSQMGSEIDFGVAIKAGFKKEAVGKIETEDSYNQFNSVKEQSNGYESKLLCRGGESQYTSAGFSTDAQAATAYDSWLGSLEDSSKWVLVDYEGSQLIPLWEFIEDASKSAAVKAAVDARLSGTGIVQQSSYKTFEMTMPKFSFYTNPSGVYADMLYIQEMGVKINEKDVKMITKDNWTDYFKGECYVSNQDGAREFNLPAAPTTGTFRVSKFKNHSVKITLLNAGVIMMTPNNINGDAWLVDNTSKYPAVSYTLNYDGAANTWTYRDANNIDHTFAEDESGTAWVGVQILKTHVQMDFKITMQ